LCSLAYHYGISDSTINPRDEVAQRVRAARIAQLLTQDDLAQRASVGRATIARLEAGALTPRMKTIRALATALGVPTDELVPNPGAVWGERKAV
jgi:transcriptional regulator with XRE-family HTH domain